MSGDPVDGCVFEGGATQLLIQDTSDQDPFSIVDVIVEGVTFTGFTNSAIAGSASDSTTLTCFDCLFEVGLQLRHRYSPLAQTFERFRLSHP
jgi:hypothetical protein